MLQKEKNNGLLKVFPVPGNFGALWCTTWQLCHENILNDLGYMKYISFRNNLGKCKVMS